MDIGLAQWHFFAVLSTGGLILLAFMWIAWHRVASRREAERRIAAARVRSGHIPLEIPTVRSRLDDTGENPPDTLPGWYILGKGEHAIVDEQPRIRIRYIDPNGKKAECTMQVDQLDVQKKVITGHSDVPGEVQRLPLHAITAARIADTGQRFNIDTWVEAVRVARRRRSRA